MLLAIAAILIGTAVFRPIPAEAASRARIDAIFVATTAVWAAEFGARGRSYSAPRLVVITPPHGHPSRGFGYFRGVALVVDAGEAADLGVMLGPAADGMIALIIAHEVGHHVQYLNDRLRHDGLVPGPARELEADCAAGWWLRAANARAAADPRAPHFMVSNLARDLTRAFTALDLLHTGRHVRAIGDADAEHGAVAARIAAYRRGAAAEDVAVCGPGVTP